MDLKGKSSWDTFSKILEEAQVVTIPGAGFGPGGEGYPRFSAFAPREACIEARKTAHATAKEEHRWKALLAVDALLFFDVKGVSKASANASTVGDLPSRDTSSGRGTACATPCSSCTHYCSCTGTCGHEGVCHPTA